MDQWLSDVMREEVARLRKEVEVARLRKEVSELKRQYDEHLSNDVEWRKTLNAINVGLESVLAQQEQDLAQQEQDLLAYRDYYGTSVAQVRHLQGCVPQYDTSRDAPLDNAFLCHDAGEGYFHYCENYPTE